MYWLFYILEYIYIVQLAKRRISPVFSFNMQIPNQGEHCRIFRRVCVLKTNTGLVCLFSICTINTKQYIYKTKYALRHHSQTFKNVYSCIGITCML